MKTPSYLFALLTVLCCSCKTTEKKSSPKPKNTLATATSNIANQLVVIGGIQNKYLQKDTSTITVFMRVDAAKGDAVNVLFNEFVERYTLNYVIYPDYASRERLAYGNVPLNDQNVVQIGQKQFMISFDVKRPANQPAGVMLAEFVELGANRKYNSELSIRFKNTKLGDRFALFDRKGQTPLLRNYVNVNDTVMFKDLAKTQKKMYMSYYSHSFDAASSPTNLAARAASRTLQVDTVMRVAVGGPITFKNEGLYYFSEDSSDSYGVGIVVVNKRFPKFTRPQELIQPVMYVSQNQEIAELKNAAQPKKALDKYWLMMMNGNTELARRTIKSFYERVEEANRLFTTYKEGWKTDKGMIYIVMGPPDKLVKAKDREVWVYGQRQNFSEINFTFNRRPNQFVEDHYELQRYVEYQPIWYPMVEAWRSGAVR